MLDISRIDLYSRICAKKQDLSVNVLIEMVLGLLKRKLKRTENVELFRIKL